MPGPSPISTISTSSSGPSIFSSASAVISSIFSSKPVSLFHGTSQQQSQQHQPTPQALPQSTRDTVLKFNPFAASPKGNREAEHSPPINIKINPFLPSPSPKENRHPSLEPKSTRGTQMPISQSQSTVASSQATGASWFNGSQPSVYSRDSIGEGEGFETDFTQSQPPLESQDKGMHWHDTKPDVKSPAPSDLRVVSATISNNSEVDEAYHFDIGEEDSGMEDPTSGPSEVCLFLEVCEGSSSKLDNYLVQPFVEPTPPSPIASQPPAVPPRSESSSYAECCMDGGPDHCCLRRVDEGLTVKAKTPKKVPSMYGLSAAMKKKDAEDQKAKAAQDEKRLAKLRRDEDDQTKGAESSQKKEESEKRKREDQPASGKPIKKVRLL
ncbi:hypothetical protein BS47DRAFT_161516 [Hydnum rufescens UP504]|uniref:Uncharacterized protein n=1 Tax=Hydnum rufescens UP504 TaxID=1448309 RepID=A0A9P6AP28_9AGAM|nr:hypothetical protein BS47DRAFT_161516 [Hydnum rufescens UP504]